MVGGWRAISRCIAGGVLGSGSSEEETAIEGEGEGGEGVR